MITANLTSAAKELIEKMPAEDLRELMSAFDRGYVFPFLKPLNKNDFIACGGLSAARRAIIENKAADVYNQALTAELHKALQNQIRNKPY